MDEWTKPAIPLDRHMTLGNLLKDVSEQLIDIMDNSEDNELIVQRTQNAVVAIGRLVSALEDDLRRMVPADMDPRSLLKQVYLGRDRFTRNRTAAGMDAFINWRKAR